MMQADFKMEYVYARGKMVNLDYVVWVPMQTAVMKWNNIHLKIDKNNYDAFEISLLSNVESTTFAICIDVCCR